MLEVSEFAALVAAAGFVFVAGFQVLLALGVPWGRAAYGGRQDELPPSLRIASAFSVVILISAALVILGRAGYWGASLPFGIFRWGTWALVALMTLSALANFASSSVWERFLMEPLAALMAFMSLLVALDDR